MIQRPSDFYYSAVASSNSSLDWGVPPQMTTLSQNIQQYMAQLS